MGTIQTEDLASLKANEVYRLDFVEVEDVGGDWMPVETHHFTYYACSLPGDPEVYDVVQDWERFFCPNQLEVDGDDDVIIHYENGSIDAGVSNYQALKFGEYFGSDEWIIPYNGDYLCSQQDISCSTNNDFLNDKRTFLTPQALPDLTFTDQADTIVPDGWVFEWTFDGPFSNTNLHFQPGRGLVVEGSLKAEDAVFTAADSDGWAGVYYTEDSGGYLRGVTIENFGDSVPNQQGPFECGLRVHNRWMGVYRSTIQGGIGGWDGVCVSGAGGQIAIRAENGEASFIQNNTGSGLRATTDGSIIITNSIVGLNEGYGGVAYGQGSVIFSSGSTFANNDKVGLASFNNAGIILTDPNNPSSVGGNTIDANEGGGLLADGIGSYIDAGQYVNRFGACQQACENNILNHDDPSIPYEVKTTSGSTIWAQYDHWGQDRDSTDLVIDKHPSSLLLINPIWDGTSLRSGEPQASYKGGKSGRHGSSAEGLMIQAFQEATDGRWATAFVQAQLAIIGAETDAEKRMVLGGLAALMNLMEAPELPGGLLLAVEAHLQDSTRPEALRALMASDMRRGRSGHARRNARTLFTDYAGTEHALAGLAAEIRLALNENDIAGARTALAQMQSVFPESELTGVSRAYFALMAGAENLPPEGFRSDEPQAATREGGLLSAYPNPFNPQTVVPFVLEERANVRISVYDLLGREVAQLADGVREAGGHEATFDASDLPSGMYLIRMEVRSENEAAVRTLTQKITLLR